MYLLYNLLLALAFLILLPRFLLDAYRHGKYVTGFRERLGFIKKLEGTDRPVLWLHCVSVGETQAARPLFQAIRRQFPIYRIVVSTVTVTGQKLAREVFAGEAERIFYFPIDWPWTVRRTLRAIEPSVVLIMETELWPGLLRACHSHKIPTAIVNGRLSEQSFRRYRLVPSFISTVVNCLDLAIMQSEADAGRMNALGLDRDRLFVSGNIKFDAEMSDEYDSLVAELAARFHLKGSQVILAASTHDPEERVIIESFRELLGRHTDNLKLVIAPRHPERFAEVASRLDSFGLRWVRRTAQPTVADAACQVILLDTIGELRSVFPLACIVFVGGSIASVGGHNILEPAAAGSCIVTGPNTENFRDIVSTFARANALIQISHVPNNELVKTVTSIFEDLLSEPEKRRLLAERARNLVLNNRGATTRTMKTLQGILTAGVNTNQTRKSYVSHLDVQSA